MIKSNGTSLNGGVVDFTVHKVTNNWVINEAGWNNRSSNTYWTNGGGDFDLNTMTSSASYDLPADSTLTITLDPSVVQDWMLNPTNNNGLILRTFVTGSANYSEIYSSGAVVAANRPMLKIWYYTIE